MKPIKDNYRIGYAFRQKTSYSQYHLGTDYICSLGTPIYMPFNGTTQKLLGKEGGNTVWIYPEGQNIIIRIMHARDPFKEGDFNDSKTNYASNDKCWW